MPDKIVAEGNLKYIDNIDDWGLFIDHEYILDIIDKLGVKRCTTEGFSTVESYGNVKMTIERIGICLTD